MAAASRHLWSEKVVSPRKLVIGRFRYCVWFGGRRKEARGKKGSRRRAVKTLYVPLHREEPAINDRAQVTCVSVNRACKVARLRASADILYHDRRFVRVYLCGTLNGDYRGTELGCTPGVRERTYITVPPMFSSPQPAVSSNVATERRDAEARQTGGRPTNKAIRLLLQKLCILQWAGTSREVAVCELKILYSAYREQLVAERYLERSGRHSYFVSSASTIFAALAYEHGEHRTGRRSCQPSFRPSLTTKIPKNQTESRHSPPLPMKNAFLENLQAS